MGNNDNILSFEEFKKLMNIWHYDTALHSSPFHIEKHIYFQKILFYDNQEDIIGYACLVVDKYLHQCLSLFNKLIPYAKHPPIDKYYAGYMNVIRECWKCWAYTENIIFSKHDVNSYWDEDKYGNNNKTDLKHESST